MSVEKPLQSIPEGIAAPPEAPPSDGMHLSTFAAGLASVFGLSMLLPFTPLTVALLSGWGVFSGFSRLVRPGWRRVPLLGWRLAFSPLDGMLWIMAMGSLLAVSGFLVAARP